MQMVPVDLSPKTPNETAHVKFKLAPALATDTIASATWSSNPGGLTFTNPAINDFGKTVEADVGGGSASQIYTVTATVVLASGNTREPWVRLPVQPAGI